MWSRAVAKYRSKQCCSKLTSELLRKKYKPENGRFTSSQKMPSHWGYKPGTVTPAKWNTLYPVADGKRQSPIDIIEEKCTKADPSSKLELDYNKDDITYVINNGHSATFFAEGSNSILRGGHLEGDHKLLQFHFHWGGEDSRGSEHTLNGKEFAAEVHLVHINTKYSSFEEALKHGDGLCVIGAFMEAADEGSPAYDRVAELIKNVTYKDQKHSFDDGFNAVSLLPEDLTTYTTYDGSLTTPPLSECVQWINLLHPIKVSRSNLAVFRSLCTHAEGDEGHQITDNYRPPQPLCCRIPCMHGISS